MLHIFRIETDYTFHPFFGKKGKLRWIVEGGAAGGIICYEGVNVMMQIYNTTFIFNLYSLHSFFRTIYLFIYLFMQLILLPYNLLRDECRQFNRYTFKTIIAKINNLYDNHLHIFYVLSGFNKLYSAIRKSLPAK